jgi:hypothetical protein
MQKATVRYFPAPVHPRRNRAADAFLGEEIKLISAEIFLEQLAERRRQAQAEALQSLPVPQDVVLPQDLTIAVDLGGM